MVVETSLRVRTFPTICIDGRQVPGAATGVARYAANLLAALDGAGAYPIRLVSEPPGEAQLIPEPGIFPLLARALVAARPGARQAARIDARHFLAPDLFREAQRYFDLYGRTLGVDLPGPPGVMHWTYPLPIHARGWRNLYTVHDLIPVLRPDLTPIDPRRYQRLLRAVARRAERIVTVSESVRAELITWLRCDPARIVDCGQGITSPGLAEPLADELEHDGFFLFVGTIEPRKNLSNLIAAYRLSGTRRPLLLSGPDGWQADRIHAEIAATPGVRILGYQPPEVTASLMSNATALLFASFAEGFGMPVVEAMAAGTPVLTSNIGALAEVAGDAALCVDPNDVTALADGITMLDHDIKFRAQLIEKGLSRARDFSPACHAERLLALYRTVVSDPPKS